jgi:hypothetical protein
MDTTRSEWVDEISLDVLVLIARRTFFPGDIVRLLCTCKSLYRVKFYMPLVAFPRISHHGSLGQQARAVKMWLRKLGYNRASNSEVLLYLKRSEGLSVYTDLQSVDVPDVFSKPQL